MNIEIYSDIKIESFYKDAQNEYIKRLGKFTKIKILKLNKLKISKNDLIVRVSTKGIDHSSTEFSRLIQDNMSNGVSTFKFIPDESYKLDNQIDNLLNNFNTVEIKIFNLNTSENLKITLLLEQIYRAFKILNNENYHK